MLNKALRNILKKDKDSIALIESIKTTLDLQICIVGDDQKCYWDDGGNFKFDFPLHVNETYLAKLHSTNKQGKVIADLVVKLVNKEIEKKKIGQEVLGLYREINMIYNFSEKVSEIIDSKVIAEIALKEASQIIKASNGLFLMYDAEKEMLFGASSFGHNPDELDNIKKYNDQLIKTVLKGNAAILSEDLLTLNPALSHLHSLMIAPLKVKHRILGMIMMGRIDQREFTAAELKLLTTISLQSASAIDSALLFQKGLQEAQEREDAIRKIHNRSLKFVPFEFIHSLGKQNLTEVRLGDQVEKEVTVMFTDIRDFTSISEKLTPRENFLFINDFNKRMGPIIRKNNGFINQYLGDGFMAIFPGGAQDALRASHEMYANLTEDNLIRIAKKLSPIKIGIGMQNGNLIMGITGDVDRLEATTISDTVNTASRIEGLSKQFGTAILLTEDCLNNLTNPEEFDFRNLGQVQVKGKENPIQLYECINADDDKLYAHKMNTLPSFKKGINLFLNKEFAMAAVTFQGIYKKNKMDLPSLLFLNRAAHLITVDVPDDWNGVMTMDKK